MHFGRNIGRSIAAIALLANAADALAEPREPLTVTQLADPESELRVATVSGNVGGPDLDAFSRAVSDAVRRQQQSVEEQCRSAPKSSGSIAAKWAREASCRYRRY